MELRKVFDLIVKDEVQMYALANMYEYVSGHGLEPDGFFRDS